MRLFEARRVSLHESIEEFRTRLKRLESLAKTDAQRAEIKRLNREADSLERQLNATRYQPPPAGADPTAQRYDPLEHLEHAESRTLEDLDKLEKDVTPQRVIPSDRPALDSETVLGEAAKYSRTGKTYQGRQIYRDGDGKLYYVDNLHKGAASEIEVFSATGEHLGTMSPDGVFDAAGKVKGRYLPKDKL